MDKRPRSESSISPPPLRRKLQSTTTNNAVASFFTPTSQKPVEQKKVQWQQRGVDEDAKPTLLVGTYRPQEAAAFKASEPRTKVAAFDFDSTLISTASGKAHASDGGDWKWWHLSVPTRLKALHDDGYLVVVISNQAGLSLDQSGTKARNGRLAAFKAKVAAVFAQLDMPISIYAATEKDIYRKPRMGTWRELLDDHDLEASTSQGSFFVGDAGGRTAIEGKAKDFSCSDRNFAANLGIPFYTPEEYFLKEAPRPYTRTFDPSTFIRPAHTSHEGLISRTNDQDIVLFCGSPGAGKSTFYWEQLKPLGYERVNQDILKSRDKCLKVAAALLASGKSVAVDNTNADKSVRAVWVELAKKHSVTIRCVLFTATSAICEHNNAVRALNRKMNPEKRTLLPVTAFTGFASRFQHPQLSEGFQDMVTIPFEFRGSEQEQIIWKQFWT